MWKKPVTTTYRHHSWLALFCALLLIPMSTVSAEGAAVARENGWMAARAAETRGDYPAMARILRPLAEEGDVAAQYTVGLLYDTGQAGKRDHAEAAKWYRKAAEQGLARAQYYLAYIHYHDTGELKNDAEAMKWYRRAADQGTAMAQHALGLMYVKGEGAPQDYVQAYKWFSLAATLLPASGGMGYQSMATKARAAVEARMTPEQVAEAKKITSEWKETNEQEAGKRALVQ